MKIDRFDHLVVTTRDLERCLHFYVDILGMELDARNGRYAVKFGRNKINIHRKKASFSFRAAKTAFSICFSGERRQRVTI